MEDCSTSANTEEQNARAFLRERYLYLLSTISSGTQCKVAMYDNTNVQCCVKAFDSNFENIIVEDLITPRPTPIKKAILRTKDIISISFNYDPTRLKR